MLHRDKWGRRRERGKLQSLYRFFPLLIVGRGNHLGQQMNEASDTVAIVIYRAKGETARKRSIGRLKGQRQ